MFQSFIYSTEFIQASICAAILWVTFHSIRNEEAKMPLRKLLSESCFVAGLLSVVVAGLFIYQIWQHHSSNGEFLFTSLYLKFVWARFALGMLLPVFLLMPAVRRNDMPRVLIAAMAPVLAIGQHFAIYSIM